MCEVQSIVRRTNDEADKVLSASACGLTYISTQQASHERPRARRSLDQRGAVVGIFFVERNLCARASCVVPIKFLCVFVSIFDFIRVVARAQRSVYIKKSIR